ncbi:MAG: GAF domain-containing protein [Chloroflexota bacterium]|nr:GAF domain-containing protein [Chloroflexota bacterium]
MSDPLDTRPAPLDTPLSGGTNAPASGDGRLNRLAEAQYAAASAIYGASDAPSILSAIIVFGGKTYQDAHLAFVEPDTTPPTLRVVARRVGSAILPADDRRVLSSYPAYEALGAVEYLHAADMERDPFLTEDERNALREQGIVAMLLVPLVIGQTLNGVIFMTHPTPVETPIEVLRALRSLADQTAVVFENRALLRRTELSLGETQTLYDLNQALLAAQDPLELLRAIAKHLASDADSIMHVVASRRRDGVEEVAVQHIITKRGEQVVNIPLKGMRAANLLTGLPVEVSFIEDVSGADNAAPMLELLKERTRSYGVIIARSGDRAADVVTIAYETPRAFDSRTRRLFAASADQLNIVLQNQRLLFESQSSAERLTRQVRVLQSLNRLATGISSFQGEKQLLDYIAREMKESLSVDHVGVVLIQGDGQTGTVISEYPDQGMVGTAVEMQSSPIIKMLMDNPNKPVIIQSVDSDPLLASQTRAALRGIGVEALMVLPLYVYGSFIGTIGFDLYERGRTFAPEMVEVAQTMTSQLAIGLQNIRLFAEAQRRAEQMQSVASFGQAVQSSLEIESVVRTLLTLSNQIVAFDQMTAALYDEAVGALRVVGVNDSGSIQITPTDGVLLSLADTAAGQVWASGTTLFSGTPATSSTAGTSAMLAPIRTRDRRIGTVTVTINGANAYTETDKAIFQQMVNLLAVALENASAYARSQRLARSEALVNEVTARFQQFSDIDGLVTTAVSELGKALGARRARIRLADPAALMPTPSSSGTGE